MSFLVSCVVDKFSRGDSAVSFVLHGIEALSAEMGSESGNAGTKKLAKGGRTPQQSLPF